MKRDLGQLESRIFDLAIIGGGVIGACIARDAARRGVDVALVEANDFAAAASEAMSHTIHGGIRYLAQGRFGLVREAIAERAVWLATAPDFVCEQKFLVPLRGDAGALKLKAGVALYERMAGGRAEFLSADAALAMEPLLAMPGLTGAAAYRDARVDDPHRLIVAMLQDAVRHGAVIANHVQCVGLVTEHGSAAGIEAADRLSGAPFRIRASAVISATGPWAQAMASRLLPGQRRARLTASKGVHIVTPPIFNTHAVALSGNGEHGFILPWHGMSLVGTTDDVCEGRLHETHATEEEIEGLAAKITRLLPHARGALQNRIGSFAGVRALPGAPGDTYRASREVAICDHAGDGMQGLYSVFGGKWTTARRIAERFLDQLAPRFEKPLRLCDTKTAHLAAVPLPTDLTSRLTQAADEEMAVREEDFCRRIGRAAMLKSPQMRTEIKAWLASRSASRDSGAGL